jgi:DNA primase
VNLAYDCTTIDQLKEIPIDAVYGRYIGNAILRRQGDKMKIRCWHGGEDKNPSGVLYLNQNTCWCFRCQAGGSNVDLVMQVLNLQFKDAVRVMASDFGIAMPGSSKEERAAARRIGFIAKAKREMDARFRRVENESHQALSSLYRAVSNTLTDMKTPEDLDQLGGLYHIQTTLEHYLEALRYGTPEDKQAALSDARRGGWL